MKQQVNNFEISGRVVYVGMPIYFHEKRTVRTVVLEVIDHRKHKNECAFDFINDRMSLLNHIRIGDWVSVNFELQGRRHLQQDGKARWYVNLEGINIIRLDNK